MHPSPPPKLPMTSIKYRELSYYLVNGEVVNYGALSKSQILHNPLNNLQRRKMSAYDFGSICINYESTPENLQGIIQRAGGSTDNFLFKATKENEDYYFRGIVVNHWKFGSNGAKLINSYIELCSDIYC